MFLAFIECKGGSTWFKGGSTWCIGDSIGFKGGNSKFKEGGSCSQKTKIEILQYLYHCFMIFKKVCRTLNKPNMLTHKVKESVLSYPETVLTISLIYDCSTLFLERFSL